MFKILFAILLMVSFYSIFFGQPILLVDRIRGMLRRKNRSLFRIKNHTTNGLFLNQTSA